MSQGRTFTSPLAPTLLGNPQTFDELRIATDKALQQISQAIGILQNQGILNQALIKGTLQVGTYVAGVPGITGYITIQDVNGVPLQISVKK